MTTSVESYRNDLMLALRLRDVPGPRIAEALAEVESHTSETREDPHDAFGEPKVYAEQVAAAVGLAGRGSWRGWWIALRGEAGVIGVLALLGGALLPHGLFHLGAGTDALRGTPAVVPLALGLGLWLVAAVRLRHELESTGDRVVDPRTGLDMAPSVPWWSRLVAVGVPVAMLVLCFCLGLADRWQ